MSSSTRQVAAGAQGASGAAGAEMQDGEPGPELPYPQMSRQKPRRNDQPTRLPYEQLQRRKWGAHDPGASIGVERKVEIRMDSRQAIIDNDLVLPIAPQASQRDLFLQILSGIDQMAQSWDAPGNGFFWVPSLNFVISPGGNAAYERMAPLIRKSGLSSTTAFTLEEARVTAPAEVKP